MTVRADDLPFLACPNTGQPLRLEGALSGACGIASGSLVTADGRRRYGVEGGIAHLVPEELPEASRIQRDHYDRVSAPYLQARATLHFTSALWGSLDRMLLEAIGPVAGQAVAEVCCGAAGLLAASFPRAAHRVGVELSPAMLAGAGDPEGVTLVCGDATRLPLRSGAFDLVVLHGGVHHVPDRDRLYSEIFRVLRPGGRVAFLEPLDDFVLWRMLRWLVYRFSPLLNADTERPLRSRETLRAMGRAGFRGAMARPCGYVAFALFANTDVMPFMAACARWPGARPISRALIGLDAWLSRVPVVRWAGMQAVFRAVKPGVAAGAG